ncbi:IS3 family transposase [Nocardia sp. NPDC051929]|uniref:IS3 family transposase n=1 Tax=unclassified Nocardia TaxID=2637762 RepID=UPI003419C9E4
MSTSGYYEWKQRGESARARADRELTATITDVHIASRGIYGAARVHAELRLGRRIRVGRKRVARLMRSAGLDGISAVAEAAPREIRRPVRTRTWSTAASPPRARTGCGAWT